MIDWDKIRLAVKTIQENEIVNRVDLLCATVYAIPSKTNRINVIRIDIKEGK